MPQVMIRRNLHISQLQASNLMDALSTILCHDGYPSLENGSPPAGKHIKVDMFSRSREHSACALADRGKPSTTGIHVVFIVIGRVSLASRLALGSVRDASICTPAKTAEEFRTKSTWSGECRKSGSVKYELMTHLLLVGLLLPAEPQQADPMSSAQPLLLRRWWFILLGSRSCDHSAGTNLI